MKKRKIVSVIMVVALAMGMLMATTVMAQSKVTLRIPNWMQAPIHKRTFVPLLEEFERLYDVNIENLAWNYNEVQDLIVRAAITGELDAEIVQTDFYTHTLLLEKTGFVEYTTDWFKDHPEYYNLASEKVWDGFSLNGEILGWYYNTHATLLTYKQSTFDDAGIDPASIVDWDNFLSAAQKFTVDTDGDGEPDTYGYLAQLTSPKGTWRDCFSDWAMGNGAEMLREKDGRWVPDVMSDNMVGAAQFFSDLRWKYGVIPEDVMGMDAKGQMMMLGEGKAGFLHTFSSLGMFFGEGGYFPTAEWVDDLRAMVVPQGPLGTTPVSSFDPGGWIINSQNSPEEMEAAYLFMQFMIDNADKGYVMGAQPAYKTGLDVYREHAPVYADFADLVPKYGRLAGYKMIQMGSLYELIGRTIQELTGQEQDVRAALEKLEIETIRALASMM